MRLEMPPSQIGSGSLEVITLGVASVWRYHPISPALWPREAFCGIAWFPLVTNGQMCDSYQKIHHGIVDLTNLVLTSTTHPCWEHYHHIGSLQGINLAGFQLENGGPPCITNHLKTCFYISSVHIYKHFPCTSTLTCTPNLKLILNAYTP